MVQALDKKTENDVLQTRSYAADVLYIIIAAHNEEAYIGPCLEALLAQNQTAGSICVVVAANACTDQTIEIARNFRARFTTRGWQLEILNIKTPGKLNAFNHADCLAVGSMRAYLDADVICDPELLGQLRDVLSVSEPKYATGTLKVAQAKSKITRAYANLWIRLPFVQSGAVGAGLFAVNASGRERWGEFPAIISDDTYVRLHFLPQERVEVPSFYHWPMVEGFRNLVRVRRRQDAGVDEVNRLYPELVANDEKPRLSKREAIKLFCSHPASFIVYTLVHLAVRLRRSRGDWTRGR